MITTTYGYKIPENGDTGAPVFAALGGNATLVDAHTHNGINSAKITSSDLQRSTISLPSGSWVATSDGTGFKQTVTCPGVYTLANSSFRFRVSSGAHANKIIHPTILPISVTSFEVVVNDSSLNLDILFT